MQSMEEAKRLILACKEPNRKPFPEENAVYSGCGHRCDLCQHYIGGSNNEEFRAKLIHHVRRVYGGSPDDIIPTCLGCSHGGLNGKHDCDQKKCATEKDLETCRDCKDFSTCKPWVGHSTEIGAEKSYSADDITWAILPYMGNL
jgi:RNA polymerase subunit RPABC4/transcription elongation factor Spt4